MRSCSRRALTLSPNVTSSVRSLGTSRCWCYDDRVSTDKESHSRRALRFCWSLEQVEIERDGRVLDFPVVSSSQGSDRRSGDLEAVPTAPAKAEEGTTVPAEKD